MLATLGSILIGPSIYNAMSHNLLDLFHVAAGALRVCKVMFMAS
jgi:hypothetical protein